MVFYGGNTLLLIKLCNSSIPNIFSGAFSSNSLKLYGTDSYCHTVIVLKIYFLTDFFCIAASNDKPHSGLTQARQGLQDIHMSLKVHIFKFYCYSKTFGTLPIFLKTDSKILK